MRHIAPACACLFFLVACTDPRSTVLPADASGLEQIQPQLQKLTDEERRLIAAFMVRRAMQGTMMAGMAGDTGTGPTTIAAAIANQRAFVAKKEAEEAQAAALAAKLQAEREAAWKAMREAVTVALVSKKIEVERGYSGIEMDRHFVLSVGFKNNTQRDVAGVKGRLVVTDLFGDPLSVFAISNDDTVRVGGTTIWTGSRSVKFGPGLANKDEKLASLPDDKFKVVWEPEAVVFADGTRLTAPPR